jgi:hypothetical protein
VPKISGLGQNFYIGGVDLSGDVGSLGRVGGGPALLDVTGINKSAPERIGGIRDGEISWLSWFNTSAGQEHPTLKTLPTTDVHILNLLAATAVGDQAAALVAKQINYDATRGPDGSLSFAIQALANAFGLEWVEMLTAGKKTDGAPANGTSIDFGSVNTVFGASAYLQVFSLTGTNVILTVQDSADNSAFSPITGLTFTSVTTAPNFERLQTAAGATIRRYVRVASSGTFSNAVFAVGFIRHLTSTL